MAASLQVSASQTLRKAKNPDTGRVNRRSDVCACPGRVPAAERRPNAAADLPVFEAGGFTA
ncbi:MAG: hypothetical protein JWR58_6202 [Pseudonocardia sp.]|nr:hypothetical protein [Pseudonocardia sp.]